MNFAIFMFFVLTLVNCAVAYIYSLEFTLSGSNIEVGSGKLPLPFCRVLVRNRDGFANNGQTSYEPSDSPSWSKKFDVQYTDGVSYEQEIEFDVYQHQDQYGDKLVSVGRIDILTLAINNEEKPSASTKTTTVTLYQTDISGSGTGSVKGGELRIHHRITSVKANRCGDNNGTCGGSAPPCNHISLPLPYILILLVVPSLNYALRLRLRH